MNEDVALTVEASNHGQADAVPPKLLVGAQLAQARIAQGYSLDLIAAHLKWSPRQIAQIEAGNYSVFPDLLSVRGFIRTYAKYLKIDPAPLLLELANEVQSHSSKVIDRPKLDMPFPDGRLPWLGKPQQHSYKFVPPLVLVFLCAVALFVYRHDVLGMINAVLPAKISWLKVDSAPVVAPLAAKQSAVAAGHAESRSSAVVVSASPVAAAEPVTEPVKTQAEPALNTSVGANALVLTFKKDSWLQIRRSNGSVLVARLFKAGSEETFEVTEPLTMVIGNAPGVDVRLRGALMPLDAQPGSNVANINIK